MVDAGHEAPGPDKVAALLNAGKRPVFKRDGAWRFDGNDANKTLKEAGTND